MNVVLVPSRGTWVPQNSSPSYRSSVPIHVPSTTRVPVTKTPTPAPAPTPSHTPAPTPSPTQTTLTSDEQAMINMVNQQRAAAGVAPVKIDSRLMTVGRQKAQDMKANNYFGHISPTYGSPWAHMQSVGLTVRWAAENITAERTVSGAMSNFMKSSGHRANILDSRLTHIGVGIAYGTSYGNIYVQEFLQE